MILAIASSACSDKASLKEFESYKAEICACKDSDCVEALDKKYVGLEEKLEGLSGADQEKATLLSMEAFGCTIDLVGDALDKDMKAADAEIDQLMKAADAEMDQLMKEFEKDHAELQADLKKMQDELAE